MLELLAGNLAYVDDRLSFWSIHSDRLECLGLQAPDFLREDDIKQAQRRQQAHFDWYASNPQQTYDAYEQTTFWQAADALAFDSWRKEIRRGTWCLDVGCGQGRSTFKLADLDLHIVAFDVSKVLVRLAVARSRQERCRAVITFLVADGTQFPLVDCSFDYVLVYGVLHHLPDPRIACMEIARMLRPGGIYFGSENNRSVFRALFDLLQRMHPLWYEEAGTQPLISGWDFQNWFRSAGMRISLRTSVFLPPHLMNLLRPTAACELLRFTDHLCGEIPMLRNQGGLILVRGCADPPE